MSSTVITPGAAASRAASRWRSPTNSASHSTCSLISELTNSGARNDWRFGSRIAQEEGLRI